MVFPIHWRFRRLLKAAIEVFIIGGFVMSGAVARAEDPGCSNRYEFCPECKQICSRYTNLSRVHILSSASELPNAVTDPQKKQDLFIVPAGTLSLDTPLHIQPGQAVLPAKVSADGFLELTPKGSFASGDQFYVLKLMEGSSVAGVSIDASRFSSHTSGTYNRKTLILVDGVKRFDATRLNLKGSADLDAVFLNDSDEISVSNSADLSHNLTRSYIDGYGATTGVVFKQPWIDIQEGEDTFSLKRLVLTVGGVTTSKPKQEAVRVSHGKGEVEHAHLAFLDLASANAWQVRELIHATDTDIDIKENVFYSKLKAFRKQDVIMDFEEQVKGRLKVYVSANSVTSKATAVKPDIVPGDEDENYRAVEFASLPDADGFFSYHAVEGKKGPSAGNCLVDLFNLRNVTQANSDMEPLDPDWTKKYCGVKWDLKGVVFSKSNKCPDCVCNDCDSGGWKAGFGVMTAAAIIGWGVAGGVIWRNRKYP